MTELSASADPGFTRHQLVNYPTADPGPDQQIIDWTQVPGRPGAFRVVTRSPGDDSFASVESWVRRPDGEVIAVRHPVQWCVGESPMSPLACEVRPGDEVPAPHTLSPDLADYAAGSLQTVVSVKRLADAARSPVPILQVETVFLNGRKRRYLMDPEATFDPSKPRPLMFRSPARPAQFSGPWVDPATGALWVLVKPPPGRRRRDEQGFIPGMQPLRHGVTGEEIPYVGAIPLGGLVTIDARVRPTQAPVSALTKSARDIPEVRGLLDQLGESYEWGGGQS